MPRYTDIDLLIDKVEETNWYHINKNGELVVGANSETDIPLYKHSDITRVLAEAPVIDVVPEREVERLKRICNSYALQYGTVRDQQKVIDEAKREVARKIFKEIKELLKIVEYPGVNAQGYITPIIAKHWAIYPDEFDDLRKKYTEGVTDEEAD